MLTHGQVSGNAENCRNCFDASFTASLTMRLCTAESATPPASAVAGEITIAGAATEFCRNTKELPL